MKSFCEVMTLPPNEQGRGLLSHNAACTACVSRLRIASQRKGRRVGKGLWGMMVNRENPPPPPPPCSHSRAHRRRWRNCRRTRTTPTAQHEAEQVSSATAMMSHGSTPNSYQSFWRRNPAALPLNHISPQIKITWD